jgi:hypothetical protein
MNYIELWVKIDIYTRIIGFSLFKEAMCEKAQENKILRG